MIPDIGLMIAAYIITRMIRVVVRKEPREHGAVIAMAIVTIVVAGIGAADLLLRGGGNLSTSSVLQRSSGQTEEPSTRSSSSSPLVGMTPDQVRQRMGPA